MAVYVLHRPALQPRVRLDLRAMVDVVLQTHHEHPPAGELAVGIDHAYLAGEPVASSSLQPAAEFGHQLLETRSPLRLGSAVPHRIIEDPARTASRSREVQQRSTQISHTLTY